MRMRTLRLELTLEGFEPSAFRVLRMEATEALSEGCTVQLTAETPELVDLDSLLGTPATLRIGLKEDAESRPFHGVVTEASLEAIQQEAFQLHVVIASPLEPLKLGRASRIFQEKSVQDIVSSVLDEAGLSDTYDWELSERPTPLLNVVQYNESDHAFISRLLHAEGIAFAVQQGADSARVRFFDDSTQAPPIAGSHLLVDRDSTQLDDDVIRDLRDGRSMASDQVFLRDYDFKRPAVDLSAKHSGEGASGREVYDHPGDFLEVAAGRTRARRLMERLRLGTRVHRGRSSCPRLEPGRTFCVTGHGRAEANLDLLITRVVHRASVEDTAEAQGFYSNDVTAVPLEVPFRPVEAPHEPLIGGTQLAFVTGASGEEIHTDGFGRVKVRFPWDRSGLTDDRSSTWLRVGQLPLSGSLIIPRVEFELLVDFEQGKLDRPFVAGHLYNAEQAPPYALPGGATRSSIQSATTGGGSGANELRFEDAAGAEEIFFNASKDFTLLVDNNSDMTVAKKESVSVGVEHVLSVGGNHYANVTGNRTLSVGANQNINVGGDYSDGVGGSLSTDVGGARMVKVGGDLAESIKGTLKRQVAALQVVTGIAGYTRKVVGDSTTKVGAAWLELAGKSRLVSVSTNFKETIGALKFIKAKQMSVTCGAGYAMTAGVEQIKCGGSRTDTAKGLVAISAGGGLKVKAQNITFTAENKLVIRGGACMVELLASGQVTIKAPTVKVKNVSVLNQLMHKGN
ncbi:Rhs element Vgr family protein [Myxococcus stipitatus DSM 14675]|uniref:Rhs element Vgr family protein n=1 Tax=Myxococcus stipitatus (strain DSM 14675 / JCM 12634 / Mx s8) TaxID=1278073 RepID=L7UNT5_MYXSD|nr:type VI secretion system tip protein TssI/VgrG [Myxococcus stipitatus]AGC48149.1 Rhs element Vgr family protein [Myxococcus stipitatus DSM 14675]